MYKKSQFPRWCVHLGGNEICLTLRGGRWRLAGRLDSLLKILHCVVGRLFECNRRCGSVIHCEKPHAHLLLSSQDACTVRIGGLDSIFLCPNFCFNFDARSQVQGCMLAGKREKKYATMRTLSFQSPPITSCSLVWLTLWGTGGRGPLDGVKGRAGPVILAVVEEAAAAGGPGAGAAPGGLGAHRDGHQCIIQDRVTQRRPPCGKGGVLGMTPNPRSRRTGKIESKTRKHS